MAQLLIPETLDCTGDGDCAILRIVPRIIDAHNELDRRMNEQIVQSREEIRLLGEKVDGLRTWIMGLMGTVIIALGVALLGFLLDKL